MSVRNPLRFPATRGRSLAILAAMMVCLFPSLVLAQGAPNAHWFDNPLANVQSVVYSPNGKMLAVAGSNQNLGVLELRDSSTGQLLQSLKTAANLAVTSVAFSSNGQTLAAGGNSVDGNGNPYGLIELWNISTGKLALSLKTQASEVSSVAFSSDGKTFADGGYGSLKGKSSGVLELWNASTGKLIQSLPTAATYRVNSVAFSSDGKSLSDGGFSTDSRYHDYGVLEMWSVSTGKLLRSLKTQATEIYAVAFSPDGKTLVEGGASNGLGLVELWSTLTGNRLQLQVSEASLVTCVGFSPDGQTVADGGYFKDNYTHYGVLEVWGISTGNLLSLAPVAGWSVNTVAFSPDGKTVADGGDYSNVATDQIPIGSAIEFWSVSSGKLIQYRRTQAYQMNAVGFAPDGKTLASCGNAQDGNGNPIGGFLDVWDASTGRLIASHKTQAGQVTAMAFSSDGKMLADVGYYEDSNKDFHGVVEVWNVSTGKLIQSLKTQATEIYAVAFSPDGKTLADGGDTVELWSIATGKLLPSLTTQAGYVASLAFSLDGKTLALGGYYTDSSFNDNGVLELWTISTGQLLHSLQTQANQVNSVAFSPDGTTLAVGGYSSNIPASSYHGVSELWNVSTGQRMRSFATAASEGVASVAFSPDGKTLVDGGNGIWELWNVSTGKETLYYDQFIGNLNSLAVSPTAEYFAYGSRGGLLVMASNPLYTPSTLQSLTLAVSSVAGGKSLTGTLTLSAPAPTANAVVTLKSSDTKVVTVPASVTLSSVAISAVFTLQTAKVTASKTVTITATYGGKTATVTLTVHP